MLKVLVTLSENDKRLLIALLLVLILVFVLIGYIGMLVTRIMRWQGKKLDNHVADVLMTKVIDNKKKFIPYALKKNFRLFFKQSWIPIVIMLVATGFLLAKDIIDHNFSYNPFNSHDGFSTLLFLWDFGNDEYYTTIFGIKVLSTWPALINEPHLVKEAWVSYIFVPGAFIGGLWYLWAVQSFISRLIRMFKLSRTVFDKNLDNFNINNNVINQANNPTEPPSSNNNQPQ